MTTLHTSNVIVFVPASDEARARVFYQQTLRLPFIGEEPYALLFRLNNVMLRVSKVNGFIPAPFTVLGWAVTDLNAEMQALADRGVTFERFEGVPQDAAGVCAFPNGDRVAWFKDPDGNLLSLTQFA